MKTENEYLSLEVNENGGCLKSIYDKKRDKELLYQPVEESWAITLHESRYGS